MTGADIVREARSFLGVRWRHQGRSRDGIDCCGLVIVVGRQLAYFDFDVTNYARVATDESMLGYARAHFDQIEIANMQPGDVAVMRFDPNRHMAFIGDYPGGGLSLIHAYNKDRRRVVECRLDEVWRSRILGCFRFRGLA
jgi:cell wall-associated NlpC family hydrolase